MLTTIFQIQLFRMGEAFVGPGPLGTGARNSGTLFETTISTAIAVISVIGTIYFVFMFITGAVAIISSGGDKMKLENARKKITSALTGIIILISAMFIIDFVGLIFGVDFLNPLSLIGLTGTLPGP